MDLDRTIREGNVPSGVHAEGPVLISVPVPSSDLERAGGLIQGIQSDLHQRALDSVKALHRLFPDACQEGVHCGEFRGEFGGSGGHDGGS
jgi:hypothetical protein